jgi:UDP-N-acetylmuramoyl-L-alanyl-D-glutamate--2,6-diaminopimelate ligase
MTLIPPRSLAGLAEVLSEVEIVGDPSLEITSIVDDSRMVERGALFVALAGQQTDGARFLRDALDRGAAALLVDRSAREVLPAEAAALLVEDVRLATARIAANAFGEPARRLRIASITGTNGKTTTSFLLTSLLEGVGRATLRVGTPGAAWRNQELAIGYTSPPSPVLHELFARVVADGVTHAVIEASSHGLALSRLAEVPIEIGIFTNVSRDHLDFHETIEAYAAAKRRLFESAESRLFNLEDPYGRAWHREFGGTSYAIEGEADFTARELELSAHGSRFVVSGVPFRLPMPGRFNVSNALAAIAAGVRLGIAIERMPAILADFPGVPGRMESSLSDGCTVIVDYAHTPDALEKVLLAIREIGAGQHLTVLFGCGGDRDPGKRREMGAIASRLADRVIVTSDNPRTEDPRRIAEAVLAGANGRAECVLDRRKAIERAILEAPPLACVVVAGKGAERVQVLGLESLPFSDRREVERVLELRHTRAARRV